MTNYVWKQGFSPDVNEDQARRIALDAADAHYRDLGYTPGEATAEVKRTDEHTAAGEYLVVVRGTYEEGLPS